MATGLSQAFGVAGVIIFSVWFVLTVAFQKRSAVASLIERADIFNIVPRWSFFSPDPGASNYHFVYRSLHDADRVGPWTELTLSPRGRLYALFNPRQRYREVLIELFQLVALAGSDTAIERIQFVSPYIILLELARKRLEGSLSAPAFYQFALVETRGPSGASEPLVRFYSLAHPVS